VDDRPDGACVIHPLPRNNQPWERPDPGYLTCFGCYKRLRSWLVPYTQDRDGRPSSIPGLYATLSAVPRVHPIIGGQPLRIGFGPRSPANDHIIAMRDQRSLRNHRRPRGDPHSVPGVLAEWVALLAAEKNFTDPPPRTVAGLCQILDRNLDHITSQPWVVDFTHELGMLRGQLIGVHQPRKVIGQCPNTIDEGNTIRICKAVLFAPLYGDTIRCWACDRPWHRPDWERLGGLLRDDRTQAAPS
jgi:hypothetical protein